MFGLDPELVRNLCYARGQKYATRLVPHGRWYINPELFEEDWKDRQNKVSQNRGKVNHSYR